MVSGGGAIYVFKQNEQGEWRQTQKLTAPDNSGIGENIAIHNNFFITGNSADNGASDGLSILDDAGSAYIFELDENELWQIDSKIVASDRSIFASFGGSVDISDNYAVVSAVGETYDENGLNPVFGSGAVYIFKRIGTGMWNQVQKIVAQDRDEGDNFGISVAISNDVVAVGAWFEDGDMGGTNAISNSGSAYIFELNNNDEWLQTQKILPSERVRSGHFGFSLAMDENDLFAGAYFNRAAYFFSNLSLINNSPICSSEPITYTATFSESATNYHFFQDLNQNGEVDTGESLQNGTSNTFTTNSLSDGDVVSVLVTTSNGTNLFTSTASIISTPENDICANAQVLDLANNSTTSTTVCANASTLSSTCTPTTNTDAWYTFTPFASEESTITVFPTGDTPIDDPVIELYSGDCNNLTYIDCADDNGSGSGEFLMQNVETETDYFIRVSGAADGEFFILVDSRVLLPVELIDFSGKAIASGNLLTWHTASEQNNKGFEVERSEDGKAFKTIGFVKGIGTTLEEQQYSFLDESPTAKVSYYRLKQVDHNSQFEYSEIIAIHNHATKEETQLLLFPNPTNDQFNIQLSDASTVQQIALYNVQGQQVSVFDMDIEQLSISDLAAGVYFLVVQKDSGRYRQVVVKE